MFWQPWLRLLLFCKKQEELLFGSIRNFSLFFFGNPILMRCSFCWWLYITGLTRWCLNGCFPGKPGMSRRGFMLRLFACWMLFPCGALVAGLLLPIFSKWLKSVNPLAMVWTFVHPVDDSGHCHRRFQRILRYGNHIAALHFNATFSADILGILMIGFIGIASTYIFRNPSDSQRKCEAAQHHGVRWCALNVALNLILIPRMQALLRLCQPDHPTFTEPPNCSGSCDFQAQAQVLLYSANSIYLRYLLSLWLNCPWILKTGSRVCGNDSRVCFVCPLIRLISIKDMLRIITDWLLCRIRPLRNCKIVMIMSRLPF